MIIKSDNVTPKLIGVRPSYVSNKDQFKLYPIPLSKRVFSVR